MFSKLTFHAKLSTASVASAKIHAHPPSMAGSVPASCNIDSATYTDISLFPGGRLDLAIGVSSIDTRPFLLLKALI